MITIPPSRTIYQTFGMDAVGNIDSITTSGTTVDNTTNDQNELTGVGGNALTYDNNGNTTTDDQGRTLIYDAWNRLVEVKDSGGTVLQTYGYDGMGRQITQTPGGSNPTRLYYSAADQVIEEDLGVSGAALQARYVWSPVYVNAEVLRDFNFAGGALTVNDRTYVMQDANYNVTGIINYASSTPGDANADGVVNFGDFVILSDHFGLTIPGGDLVGDFNHDGVVNSADETVLSGDSGHTGAPTWSVAERLVYDAYGKFTVQAANWDSATDIYAWNYTFQGMRYDPITKLNITLSRVYEAETGRFLTVDPSGLSGMNNYWAFGDNPVDQVDPTGNDFIAIADRNLTAGDVGLIVPGWKHYSLEYWKSDDVCDQGKKYMATDWMADHHKSTKLESVELLPLRGVYSVWRGQLIDENEPEFKSPATGKDMRRRQWGLEDVWVSVIHYSDSGDRFKDIFDSTAPQTNRDVKDKWDKIIKLAKSYPFAEQDPFFGNFQHWPNSEWERWGNNSNTFIRWLEKESGLAGDLDGNHKGNELPISIGPDTKKNVPVKDSENREQHPPTEAP